MNCFWFHQKKQQHRWKRRSSFAEKLGPRQILNGFMPWVTWQVYKKEHQDAEALWKEALEIAPGLDREHIWMHVNLLEEMALSE